MIRESVAMSKAYLEARAQHGESELLDEIVTAKPETDHTRYHSAAELRDNGLKHLRDAVALLEAKATTGELDEQWTAVPGEDGTRASGGRSSVLDGMHAQYAHSPPISSRSATATRLPAASSRSAATSPPGPHPDDDHIEPVHRTPPDHRAVRAAPGSPRRPSRSI